MAQPPLLREGGDFWLDCAFDGNALLSPGSFWHGSCKIGAQQPFETGDSR